MPYSDTNRASTAIPATGLLGSVQRLLATFIEIVLNRVGILSTELDEEWIRIREIFFYQFVSAFFMGLALLLGTLFVVLVFWESHRLSVLAAFAVLYLAIGIGAALVVRQKLKTRPMLFSATLSELRKDCSNLGSRS